MNPGDIASLLIAITELAKIGAVLVEEDREPTEDERLRIKNAVSRANSLWERAGGA